MSVDSPPRSPIKPDSDSESIWSLAAFWLVAFASAGLFAIVAIAPKWDTKQSFRKRVTQRAMECAHLRESNHHLRSILDAFRHDPDYTAEMARIEFIRSEVAERRIPAPIQHRNTLETYKPNLGTTSAWTTVMTIFARDSLVREASLFTAAIFAVVSLTFFNTGRDERDGPHHSALR